MNTPTAGRKFASGTTFSTVRRSPRKTSASTWSSIRMCATYCMCRCALNPPFRPKTKFAICAQVRVNEASTQEYTVEATKRGKRPVKHGTAREPKPWEQVGCSLLSWCRIRVKHIRLNSNVCFALQLWLRVLDCLQVFLYCTTATPTYRILRPCRIY